MKPALRLSVLFVTAAALLFAGCSKKPARPNPSQTVFGQGQGAGMGLNPTDVFAGGDTGLELRDDSFGTGNQQRGILPNVYFDFDSASIRVAERAKLTEAANYLSSNPGARILLEGHCDWRGTTEYNMGLGDRRAIAAKDFLATLGVASARIETVSKGDLEAIDSASADQMQEDRRVELVVVQ